MIKFDISKLRTEHVHLKTCTTALGGSVRVVDDHLTATTGKEVYKKIKVPMAVVRTFQETHKMSQYFKPVVTALVYYGDQVVAIERHPLGTLGEDVAENFLGEMRTWVSDCERNVERFVKPRTENGDWFVDGKYLYHFANPTDQCIREGEYLSEDGKFRAVEVVTIQLSHLNDRSKLQPTNRTCLAFVASNGQFALTPPIWKNLGNVGTKNLQDGEVGDKKVYQFDAIDQQLSVNLSFVLRAGNEIGTLFGHEAIEPLQLPELMIKLRTVNLPNVANAVKQTYNAGISFTHAMAWLIGLTSRSDTMDGYMAVRSLLKYLTTKGIFRAELFSAKHVFKRGNDIDSIPYIGIEEAKKNASTLSIDQLIEQIRNNNSATRRVGAGETSIGSLYGAN